MIAEENAKVKQLIELSIYIVQSKTNPYPNT
jgi:hypothetical protein